MSKNKIKKAKDYEYVFFDLDGTLTDSAEGIINSAKLALEIIGIEEDEQVLYSFIGPPLKYSFEQYIGIDEELGKKALKAYRERYEVLGWKENKLYDGIYDLVKDLKKAGKKIALASAKPEPYCKKILEYFDLMPFFEFVGGATFDGKREDKADIIAYSLKNIGNPDKNKVIMVGDRNYDIIGAHKMGIEAVGVYYGYAVKGELEEADADYIAETVSDLYDILL